MIRFSVLGSGSRGNCVYVESEKSALLIDCGFSGKETAARLTNLGRKIEKVEAILVTHEHHDHVAGVGVVARKCKIPVFANVGTFQGAQKRLGKIEKVVHFDTGDSFTFKDFNIKSFRISHDTNDAVGFVVESKDARLGYCTDTGKATHLMAQRLKNCHGVVLEFNHDPIMLKNGPYPLAVQQRVRSSQGHLSNAEAAEFLDHIWHEDLQRVILAHISETNNLPELAMDEVENQMGKSQEGTTFHIARQTSPTELFTLRP